MKFGIQTRGIREAQKNLSSRLKNAGLITARGVLKAGFFLQREAQKLCPVQTGFLKNSARTELIDGETSRPSARVSFNASYGVFVHENMQAHHKPGKQAKFLEQPLNEKADEIIRIIKEG